MTFSKARDGGLRVPYADVFLRWSYPHLIRHRLGLELRASYTRETNLSQTGQGNAARLPAGLQHRILAAPGAQLPRRGELPPPLLTCEWGRTLLSPSVRQILTWYGCC